MFLQSAFAVCRFAVYIREHRILISHAFIFSFSSLWYFVIHALSVDEGMLKNASAFRRVGLRYSPVLV